METPTTTQTTASARLERPEEGRVLAGVANAIARRADTPVVAVRVAFLVSALIGGLGILLYAAGWVLIPSEGTDQSPAEDWLDNLTTPGRRLGAFAVGLAGLIVLATMSPVAIAAAVVLLGAAALLAPAPRKAASDPSPTDSQQE